MSASKRQPAGTSSAAPGKDATEWYLRIELPGRPPVRYLPGLGAFQIGRGDRSITPDLLVDDDCELASRQHCCILVAADGWTLHDGPGVNGTYVQRAGTRARVTEPVALAPGDQVIIPCHRDRHGTLREWILTIRDSRVTVPDDEHATGGVGAPCIHLTDDHRVNRLLPGEEPVLLGAPSPKVWALLSHMHRRNTTPGETPPVLCSVDELLQAVYADEQGAIPFGTFSSHITQLVHEARKFVEPPRSSRQPFRILLNTPGHGYQLRTCQADRRAPG